MSLPEGFSLRSARDEDAERAAELVNQEARVHLGTPIWSTDAGGTGSSSSPRPVRVS